MTEIITYGPVADVAQLFDNVSDDRTLSRMFLYKQTQDLARLVGVKLVSNQRELNLVGAIRELLEADEIEVPTCNCAGMGEGLRWSGADNLASVRYSIDASFAGLFDGAESYMHEAFSFVSDLAPRLTLVPTGPGETPNITVRAGAYDGRGRTLGVTSFYRATDENLDVFRSRTPAVEIVFDTAEFWTADFFRTVARHEVIHAVGIDHAPTRDDLMYASYTGIRLTHPGTWTQAEMDLRYRLISAGLV